MIFFILDKLILLLYVSIVCVCFSLFFYMSIYLQLF